MRGVSEREGGFEVAAWFFSFISVLFCDKFDVRMMAAIACQVTQIGEPLEVQFELKAICDHGSEIMQIVDIV